jgi:hypothetical protein
MGQVVECLSSNPSTAKKKDNSPTKDFAQPHQPTEPPPMVHFFHLNA